MLRLLIKYFHPVHVLVQMTILLVEYRCRTSTVMGYYSSVGNKRRSHLFLVLGKHPGIMAVLESGERYEAVRAHIGV